MATRYADPINTARFNLACGAIRRAVSEKHLVVCADYSQSGPSKDLQSSGAILIRQLDPGLGFAKRQAAFHALEIAKAKGSEIIILTKYALGRNRTCI